MGTIWNSTIERRKRPPRVGRRGKRLRERGLIFGELCVWIRRQRCFMVGLVGHVCTSPIRACHVERRGQGYHDWLEDGSGNVIPACDFAHDLIDGMLLNHGGRKQVERECEVDLNELAADYGREYRRFAGLLPEQEHER